MRVGFGLPTIIAASMVVLSPWSSVHADNIIPPVEYVETTYVEIQSGLLQRGVLYLKPQPGAPGYQTAAPALVLLAYLGGAPAPMAGLTEAARLAREQGYWVILPAPLRGNWHESSLLGLVDDVRFINNAIDDALNRFPIDPARIYMAGYSEGGRMTQAYLCQSADRIAGAAIVASALRAGLERGCDPPSPTPMLFIHGTADPIVPYDGNLVVQSAAETAAFWASINGCGDTLAERKLPNRVNDGLTVTIRTYTDCKSGAMVQRYTVLGGGHTWPGTLEYSPGLGRTAQDFDATRLIGHFMSRFQRQRGFAP